MWRGTWRVVGRHRELALVPTDRRAPSAEPRHREEVRPARPREAGRPGPDPRRGRGGPPRSRRL